METGIVISTCYVIQSGDYGVEPVIYLHQPTININNEKLHGFTNPFDAKKFIRTNLPDSIEITVSRETHSQLLYSVQC